MKARIVKVWWSLWDAHGSNFVCSCFPVLADDNQIIKVAKLFFFMWTLTFAGKFVDKHVLLPKGQWLSRNHGRRGNRRICWSSLHCGTHTGKKKSARRTTVRFIKFPFKLGGIALCVFIVQHYCTIFLWNLGCEILFPRFLIPGFLLCDRKWHWVNTLSTTPSSVYTGATGETEGTGLPGTGTRLFKKYKKLKGARFLTKWHIHNLSTRWHHLHCHIALDCKFGIISLYWVGIVHQPESHQQSFS